MILKRQSSPHTGGQQTQKETMKKIITCVSYPCRCVRHSRKRSSTALKILPWLPTLRNVSSSQGSSNILMSLAVADVNRWISSKRFSPCKDGEKES